MRRKETETLDAPLKGPHIGSLTCRHSPGTPVVGQRLAYDSYWERLCFLASEQELEKQPPLCPSLVLWDNLRTMPVCLCRLLPQGHLELRSEEISLPYPTCRLPWAFVAGWLPHLTLFQGQTLTAGSQCYEYNFQGQFQADHCC